MLLELKVTNFAIIDNLHIQFKPGFNILSGETGAGKSVLLKSLSLLMGLKSSTESIRTGCNQASIEGSFDLSHRKDILAKIKAQGIEIEDDLLIVKRVIAEEKSRVYLNGSLSALNTLRDIVSPLIEVTGDSAPLIEMTGQFESRHLLSKNYHMDLLDQYTGNWELRSEFEKRFELWSSLKKDVDAIQNSAQNKSQRLDFLIYQRDEIKKLNLMPGEETEIENEIKGLKDLSKLSSFVQMAESTLVSDEDSAAQRIAIVLQSSLAGKHAENLRQAKVLIEETAYDLRQHLAKLDSDPGKLDALEERLSDLRKVQKKYGQSSEQILAALVQIENEIDILENSDKKLAQMLAEIENIKKQLLKIAEDMHKKRIGGAKLLSDSVNDELVELNMKGVLFRVRIAKNTELAATGITEVEFMTQSSASDEPRPLARYASGGELSRILLSLKQVVGTGNHPRTYLFDEVDTGVSGPTAEKVGRKLKSIAKGQQVICITHLPQVASFGDAHFYIQKSPQKNSIAMEVAELKKQDRVKEIARLISGEKITKTSLAHAEQLLSEAK